MKVINRIKEIIVEKYGERGENLFSKEIGIPQVSLNNYTSGRRKVSFEVIDAILRTFPEVSAEWLLRGQGSMFIEQASPASNVIPAGMTGVYDAVIKGKDELIKELETEVNQLIGENNIMREQLGIGERRASGKSA